MSDQPRIVVCGAGAAGTAIAADVAFKGVPVTLFEIEKMEHAVKGIREKGGIELTDDSNTTSGRTGFVKIDKVTTDPAEALSDADGIMITVPALHHDAFFETLAPHFKPGQFVLFNTGYWGALRYLSKKKELGVPDEVTLCETNIMPYLSQRVDGPEGYITKVFNCKKLMYFAALPGKRTDEALKVFKPAYKEFEAAPDVIWTNLGAGGNHCVHVQLTLPVFGYIFDRFRGAKFYTECTDQFAYLSNGFDVERKKVAEKLGFEIEPNELWLERSYGYKGRNISDALRKSPHSDRYSPLASLDRVLDEDICYSFVPICRLAESLGVDMPLTRGMIEVTGCMIQKDYWNMGLTLEDINLAGLDAAGVMERVS